MDSDEEILSTYSSLTVTSRSATTISTRDSASNAVPAVVDQNEEVFEDASSDISILTKRVVSSIRLDRTKLRIAVHQDLCTHTQKIYEPLFLRKCEVQTARQGSAPPNIIPIQNVEIMDSQEKMSCHSALLTSLNSPTYCVRFLAANISHKPKNVLVYASPINFVRFVVRPEHQQTSQSVFEDPSETVSLMMSPDESIVAKRMIPKWQTVTFTLAFGKNVAVKYRVIETRKQPILHVNAKVDRVKRVPTSTLYRIEPEQRVEYWNCFKANELKLSTVEKNDPQIVKRVFLETSGDACHSVDIVDGYADNNPPKDKKTTSVKLTKELNLMWRRADE